jgi:hypothetical protein
MFVLIITHHAVYLTLSAQHAATSGTKLHLKQPPNTVLRNEIPVCVWQGSWLQQGWLTGLKAYLPFPPIYCDSRVAKTLMNRPLGYTPKKTLFQAVSAGNKL